MRSKFKPGLTGTLVVLILAVMAIPVPYVMTSPGPIFNTIGELNGTELISISGTETFPTTGELDMTTVREYGGPQEGLQIFQAIWGWLSPDNRVVPREAIYPPNQTEAENIAQNAEAFSSSQSYATAAALRYLNLPVVEQVIVSSVGAGAPALDKLRAGDQIVAVDDAAISKPEEVVNAVRSKPIGAALKFSVIRTGNPLEVIVISGSRPDDSTTPDESKIPYVGIGVDVYYQANFEIAFGVEGVGGPSAGTMFAIGIIDKLTPGALADGKVIAGTGTIDPDGNVGEIGGIQQKLIGAREEGAELFLAPESNCKDVVGHIPTGLTVVPVTTLSEAMAAIADYKAGNILKECSIS